MNPIPFLPRCLSSRLCFPGGRLATLLLLLLLGASSALAAGLSPEQVAKLRGVGSVVVSPDGVWVAYTVAVPRTPFVDEDGPSWTELHLLDTRDGSDHPFITGKQNVSAVRFVPGGKHLAFLAKRGDDEKTSLYLIPLDGGEARRVLSHETGVAAYAFNHDGTRIAFLAKEKLDSRRKKLEEAGIKTEVYEEELPFTRVYVAAFDVQKGAGEPTMLDLLGNASDLRYSPVDDRLALTLAPTPRIDDHYMRRRVRVIDARSGEILARVENPGKIGGLKWSPDGKRLAMLLGADIHDPSPGRLTVVDADGGELTDVLPGLFETGAVNAFAWKDPNTLVYVASVGVWTEVGEVGIGGKPKKLVEKGGPILHGVSISEDGKTLAFVGDTPQHPREVFVMDRKRRRPTRMSWSNPWLDEVELAEQEVVHFTARDGLPIEGVLIHPLHEEPGRRVPLVLYVHGGPESHHTNGWSTRYSNPGQVLAGRGIAVFMINYRGSTGYGVPFSKADHGDFAGKEFDDLVDGVDHLVERGLVDRDKVGVTGGSYGGYATGWLCTKYTDRFAAGVMFAGISDNISKFGTSDIPDEMFLVHQRKRTFDDWDFFLERSPVYWAGQARTPLLIAHGKADPRVNVGQAMELYRHIKVRTSTSVRLVLYPGEGHGNRRAAARYDYNLRMLRWLETYLKGDGTSMPPVEIEYPLEDAVREEAVQEEAIPEEAAPEETAAAPEPTEAGVHPFSVHDMLAMQRISSPAPSPDGTRIAFVVKTIDVENNTSDTDLWLVGVDGSRLQRLTSHPAADFNPVWSPDGRWIYFLSTRGGTSQVWRIAPDGGEAEAVTHEPLDVGNLEISPDGRNLAYSMDVFVDCPDVDCTVQRLEEIAERPDSGRIYDRLFIRHWDTWEDGRRTHVFVRSVEGPPSVDLCRGLDGNTPSRPFGGAEEFCFTPDSRAVVFSMKVAGREEAWSTNFDLYVSPIDGSAPPRNLTVENPAWDTQPVFSPDGKTLAYLAMKRAGYESDRYRIVLRSWDRKTLSAGPARWLTEDFDRSFYGLFFGPKGRSIYCFGPNLGQRALWKVRVKDGRPTLLHSMCTVRSPAFAGDRIVFGLDHLRSPVELYSIRPDGNDLQRITHINDRRVAAVEMGEPEQFTFEGAGGDTVYGYVVKPAEFDSTRHYPVAFLIHGGPQGSFGNDFHYRWNPQAYAGAGYAAVMIDFHGSTGYGQAFCDAIRGDWGGKPLEDLKKGLAAALGKYPWMDGDRVAALGASYGGYMINWIAGNWPDRFTCLVAHDGNLDERAAYYQTEELWFPEWDHMGKPWTDPRHYEDQNPVNFVQNWKTPMLIIHGGKDYRVDLSGGIGSFTACQRLGIPSKFLYFPDENHWVLKPQNSILWHDTVIGWLDQWTK